MPKEAKGYYIEAFFYMAWARLLKRHSFSKLALILGEHMQQTTFKTEHRHVKTIQHVSSAIQVMSKYTFWESECLVQAIAAMKMLQKRCISNTLYLGTAKDKQGKFVAHAWLRSGTHVVTGFEGMEHYTVVATFANNTCDTFEEGVVNEKQVRSS